MRDSLHFWYLSSHALTPHTHTTADLVRSGQLVWRGQPPHLGRQVPFQRWRLVRREQRQAPKLRWRGKCFRALTSCFHRILVTHMVGIVFQQPTVSAAERDAGEAHSHETPHPHTHTHTPRPGFRDRKGRQHGRQAPHRPNLDHLHVFRICSEKGILCVIHWDSCCALLAGVRTQ